MLSVFRYYGDDGAMPPLWNINFELDAKKVDDRGRLVNRLPTPDRARLEGKYIPIVIYLAPPNLDVLTLTDVGSKNASHGGATAERKSQ